MANNKTRRPCQYPGCANLVDGGYCAQHKMRSAELAYRNPERNALYDRKWQRRRRLFLAEHPWCADCLDVGIYTAATDVHHVERHQGDEQKFLSSPLQALCHACHSRHTNEELGRGHQKVSVRGASSGQGPLPEIKSRSEETR